jgi:hypothetical protein
MIGSDPDPLRLAQEFADELNGTLAAVLPGDLPEAVAEWRGGSNPRVVVSPRTTGDTDGKVAVIPLSISGDHRLNLRVEMFCALNRARYLVIEESKITLELADSRAAPLFRFEYDYHAYPGTPAAHLHVHAHRDEIVFLTGRPSAHRPKQRAERGRMNTLAELHMPLGGHRFRPCLEDVLEFAVREFGVDTNSGWEQAIRDGRTAWRRKQTNAAVTDSPDEAARTLRELGYAVTPPQDSSREERTDRLTAF